MNEVIGHVEYISHNIIKVKKTLKLRLHGDCKYLEAPNCQDIKKW